MFIRRNFLFLVAVLTTVLAVVVGATVWQRGRASAEAALGFPDEPFQTYWFSGKAELTSYDLRQVQYGQANPGEAVLVFVTEDFRTDKQVKLESDQRDKATPVLKLNQVRKFVTGIYDYSAMTSVFMPLDTRLFPHALKVTASTQEWCGHTYQQLNLRGRRYHLTHHSYFEKEADQETTFDRAWLEDELWTRLRLSPETLPTGDLEVVPSLFFSRLKHRTPQPERATAARRDTTFAGQNVGVYTLGYPGLQRRVELFFEKTAPFRILGWEETTVEKGHPLTTHATRRQTLVTDYWKQHRPEGKALRDRLKIQ
jgi:hypothetical protein